MKIFFVEIKGTSNYLHNGLACLAGALRNKHQVKIFDLNILDWSEEQVLETVLKEKPDLVGFSLKSFNLRRVLNLAKIIKSSTSSPKLIIGGPHITLCPEEFFSRDNNDIFDFGYQGEGDSYFPHFCEAFGIEEEYKNIPGLIYKNKDEWHFNKNNFIKDLDTMPFPSFDDFVGVFDFENQEGYPLLTSRGCPYKCIYCSVSKVSGGVWRFRSPSNIVKEIKEAILKYNIKSFKIIDDNFTLNVSRAKDFCHLLVEEKLNLSWTCPNGLRADRMDDELAGLMKRAGCKAVSLGIESGDEKTFDFINKGEKLADIEKAVKVLKKNGLKVDGFFIIGLPFETVKSVKKSVKFIKKLGIDNIKWNMLVPYPQTFLWDWVKENAIVLTHFTKGQHFSREKSVNPTFETDNYSVKDRIKAYKIANLSTGSYQYVFKRPNNIILFYLKYSAFLIWYTPTVFMEKCVGKTIKMLRSILKRKNNF